MHALTYTSGGKDEAMRVRLARPDLLNDYNVIVVVGDAIVPHHWKLQEAKARLPELMRRARQEGPQEITVHGKVQVVVLSREEYERLKERKPHLVDVMRNAPLQDVELEHERVRVPVRDVKL